MWVYRFCEPSIVLKSSSTSGPPSTNRPSKLSNESSSGCGPSELTSVLPLRSFASLGLLDRVDLLLDLAPFTGVFAVFFGKDRFVGMSGRVVQFTVLRSVVVAAGVSRRGDDLGCRNGDLNPFFGSGMCDVFVTEWA